ncbi:MAG: hypothetical protein IJD48_04245 [Clostridia bacterium]|nr:hypothetical protein [Clostridia bacterium]
MAFYTYMSKKYSTLSNPDNLSTEERMLAFKTGIEGKFAASIKESRAVAEDVMLNYSVANISTEAAIASFQAEEIMATANEDQKALDYISSLSPQQYFAALAKKEVVELKEFIASGYEQAGAATERLINLEHTKGIAAKFYRLTGKTEQKIEETQSAYDQAIAGVDAAKEALREWVAMPADDKAGYIIDRSEQSGLLSLDTENLTKYALNYHLEDQATSQGDVVAEEQ